MTKLLFFTDCHFRYKSPLNRTDNILETQLKKMEWILNYAKENDCIPLCGGDFWHTPSQPDYVANKVADLFEKYKIVTYFLIGNHDCVGGNIDSYKENKIGLFRYYSWYRFLVNGLETKDVIVQAYDFSRDLECPEHIELKGKLDKNDKRIRIVVVHSMITDDPSVTIDGRAKTINWCSIQTSADIILTGHYHPGFGVKINPFNTRFVNPGGMVRLEASKIEMARKPQIAVLKIDNENIDIELVEIPHSKDVFNIDHKNTVISSEDEKQKFIDALGALKDEEIMAGNVCKMLDNIKNLPDDLRLIITQKIVDRCKAKVASLREDE